jgi:hypothetical protein
MLGSDLTINCLMNTYDQAVLLKLEDAFNATGAGTEQEKQIKLELIELVKMAQFRARASLLQQAQSAA